MDDGDIGETRMMGFGFLCNEWELMRHRCLLATALASFTDEINELFSHGLDLGRVLYDFDTSRIVL